MIDFYKYQGTGNDFILIDNRSAKFSGNKKAFAIHWCNRRFGVGSDGIIFLEKDSEVDFYMDFYNPDGSQSFCGNGSRCAVAFADFLGVLNSKTTSFKAIDGNHIGVIGTDEIRIKMRDVESVEMVGTDYFINTGSPHYISYETNSLRDIVEFGRHVRFSEQYKEQGINVNLVEVLGENQIAIRTYERGVEDETFSCGTGATAAGLSYAYKNDLMEGIVKVNVKGGKLKIEFKKNNLGFSDVWLEGPALQVYKGTINDSIN